ncbi:MAG: hypothetical protein ACE5FK_09565, partial [Candidatus Methylomirabilia bacterium]
LDPPAHSLEVLPVLRVWGIQGDRLSLVTAAAPPEKPATSVRSDRLRRYKRSRREVALGAGEREPRISRLGGLLRLRRRRLQDGLGLRLARYRRGLRRRRDLGNRTRHLEGFRLRRQ